MSEDINKFIRPMLLIPGATLVNILIPGTIKSFGVLLVEFNEVFNTTASTSNGIVALCYFLYSSLGEYH